MMQSITALFLIIVSVDAHGRFSNPPPRAISGGGGPNAPTYTCAGPAFGTSATSMRCHDGTTPGTITPVTAGQELDVAWIFEAAHPGDCSIWISYDADIASPVNWVKLLDMPGCLSPNGQTPQASATKVAIPANIPNCEHCVMRWEWYATQQVTNVEFYVQCFDVKIVGGNDACSKPAPTTAISDISHLGSCAGTGYYNPYNGNFDPNRSRGPKVFEAPASCGGGATTPTRSAPTPFPTVPPTQRPTTPPTTLSPTAAGETRSPTGTPTRSPTFGTSPTPYVAPPLPPQNTGEGYPITATASFSDNVKGSVTFQQYGSGLPTFITISLKNSQQGLSTTGNELSVLRTCGAKKEVYNPTGANLGSEDCVGCLAQRYTGIYDGRIGSERDGTTNVQTYVDPKLSLGGVDSIILKNFAVTSQNPSQIYCATIEKQSGGQNLDSSSAHVSIVMSSLLCFACFLFV